MGRHFRDPKLLAQIAVRIKELRREKKITLEDFYHDTGIHLARIEASKGNVTVSTLTRFASILGRVWKNWLGAFDNLTQLTAKAKSNRGLRALEPCPDKFTS